MRLFTSSSEKSFGVWLLSLLSVFLIVGTALVFYERMWRDKGYVASVQDTKQFWSVHRALIYSNSKIPLVFLGASRTLYGIDMNWLKRNAPKYAPIMLAVNGHYPLAILKDLADDERFKGIVMVDVDSRGLRTYHHFMLQSYVDYYHQEFTPNKWLHHFLLAKLQSKLVFLDQKFSLLNAAKYNLGQAPYPVILNTWMDTQRNSGVDLLSVDASALANWFAELVEEDMRQSPPESAADWLHGLSEVAGWVRRIESRGGKVIFYAPPVSGRLHELEQHFYPREQYWDVFLSHYALNGLVTTDIPLVASIPLPDESHMHFADKEQYTRALFAWISTHADPF
ncbi:MAG: hypothetical protein GXZ05_08790 [Gammaproteobacteria bacterium]|nr:hypothetical protein [Gammaproteobacteria bacterium]